MQLAYRAGMRARGRTPSPRSAAIARANPTRARFLVPSVSETRKPFSQRIPAKRSDCDWAIAVTCQYVAGFGSSNAAAGGGGTDARLPRGEAQPAHPSRAASYAPLWQRVESRQPGLAPTLEASGRRPWPSVARAADGLVSPLPAPSERVWKSSRRCTPCRKPLQAARQSQKNR